MGVGRAARGHVDGMHVIYVTCARAFAGALSLRCPYVPSEAMFYMALESHRVPWSALVCPGVLWRG